MKIGDKITRNEGKKLWTVIDINSYGCLWIKRGKKVSIISGKEGR